ncbi:protein mesh [Trichonephila inaurata madagascariensis]|nr:protein mesh [Trichonephila inaurata madagascariensis]
MFNYDSINWISDKDNYDGIKGVPAFVGFNAGNRTRAFEFVPYSQNPRISRLPSLGFGNGLKGRFYFQINEEILSGSCIERYLDVNWSDRPKLTFFPRHGSMLGGTMVNITGPCVYDPESVIRCKFDTLEVDGIYRNLNTISCVSPPVMYHGYVDLSVSIDQGPFLFYGKYYVVPPGITEADVNVLNGADKLEAPERFTIEWKNEKLTWNTGAPVTISLWGYKETNETYPKLTYIDEPGQIRHSFWFHIAINLTHPEITKDGGRHTTALWSDPLPLGWYFRHQWQRKYGNSWKKNICEDWYLKEKNSERFNTTLSRCPCTLEQAKQDVGRFVPDLQCNEIDRKCETFHRPAYHCVTSGRPAIGGGGHTHNRAVTIFTEILLKMRIPYTVEDLQELSNLENIPPK